MRWIGGYELGGGKDMEGGGQVILQGAISTFGLEKRMTSVSQDSW